MYEDKELLRDLWTSQLPIKFELAREDVASLEQPQPVFLLVPRISYFPLCWDKVKTYFKQFISDDVKLEHMWLEFNGQTLRWNIPIGVLYDLFAAPDQNNDMQSSMIMLNSALPWAIRVHFKNFPQDELLKCDSLDVVEAHLIMQIKEADVLKHKEHVMPSFQKKDHNHLWRGMLEDRFDEFWIINRKLMEPDNADGFKYIPFRLYEKGDPSYTQKLVKPVNEDNSRSCLKDLVAQVISDGVEALDSGKKQIWIQGIRVPLETPLQWLAVNMSHPDNFIHIVVSSSS